MEIMVKIGRRFPTTKAFRLPKIPFYVKNKTIFKIFYIMYNVIPAAVVDSILRFSGSKKMHLQKVTRDIYYFLNILYFFGKPFVFESKNALKLYEEMTAGDEHFFPCNKGIYEVEEFVQSMVMGMRKFYLKETDKDLEAARRKLKILYIIDYTISAVVCVALYLVFRNFFKLQLRAMAFNI